MGGEELNAFLWCLFVRCNSTRDTIERAILVRGFPLTPRPPSGCHQPSRGEIREGWQPSQRSLRLLSTAN